MIEKEMKLRLMEVWRSTWHGVVVPGVEFVFCFAEKWRHIHEDLTNATYLISHDSHAMLGKNYNSNEANRFITGGNFHTISIYFHLIIVII